MPCFLLLQGWPPGRFGSAASAGPGFCGHTWKPFGLLRSVAYGAASRQQPGKTAAAPTDSSNCADPAEQETDMPAEQENRTLMQC